MLQKLWAWILGEKTSRDMGPVAGYDKREAESLNRAISDFLPSERNRVREKPELFKYIDDAKKAALPEFVWIGRPLPGIVKDMSETILRLRGENK